MEVLDVIAGLFNIFILVIILAIGIYTLLVDASKLRKREFFKEMKIAKIISYIYIVGGLISFIALKILE
ncbi:CLC_0170 family protein [Alkaliphilus transvaalensis]|uniref:CLC_0170 family protein n=1 Tax=Alkaliphilus transvaalensis TaxID=114628 RepID=UPI00047E1D1C|nr:CLC_0170 family protein [Alkaliphilus transvaalensis]